MPLIYLGALEMIFPMALKIDALDKLHILKND